MAMVLGNFQCRCVLLIGNIVWQGPTGPAAGGGAVCFDILSLVYYILFLSPSLGDGLI